LRKSDAASVAGFIRSNPRLLKVLENLQLGGNGSFRQVVSTHDDQLISVERGYGEAKRPEDYLDSFKQFILENQNKIAALNVAVMRPRDLTREDLRLVRVTLANANFNETAVRTAWREARNEDIAASIIGYIRQLAIGSPLVPFDARVDRAIKKILASQAWPAAQQKWLERIAKEMKRSIIIDQTTFGEGAFANAGGFRNMQHVFDNNAQAVIDQIGDAVWEDVA